MSARKLRQDVLACLSFRADPRTQRAHPVFDTQAERLGYVFRAEYAHHLPAVEDTFVLSFLRAPTPG
ncbi:hypothetical protein [Streptomyces sp. RPT161]|uniref:hypothetical protein n=1 Tax=Streptomyces sp. RPT161 TaxID=3015993 RepID=UPI0022B8D2B7|nr:hypothetical protein [Streptomyces sp. RPT161]